MKRTLIVAVAAAVGLSLAPIPEAEAKRLGGGSSFGMNRSVSPMKQASPPAKPATPAQNAAPASQPAPAAAAAGAAAQKSGMSRWMGPIAGLAAGIGLAALLSHFGMGEAMANLVMILLLVMAAVFVFRLIFRRASPQARSGMQYAGAGNAAGNAPLRFEAPNVSPGASSDVPADSLKVSPGGTAATAANGIPADFDVDGFLRQAKLNFVRLQAANDRGDMADIAQFTTPEVFAEIQMQHRERGQAAQQTDVVTLNAELLEIAEEGDRYIASVRYFGQLREEADAAPADFDEMWHLVKPRDGSRGWQVAGIQQTP